MSKNQKSFPHITSGIASFSFRWFSLSESVFTGKRTRKRAEKEVVAREEKLRGKKENF